MRSCWSTNWESVTARAYMPLSSMRRPSAARVSVRQAGDVLGHVHDRNAGDERRERARDRRCVLLGHRARAAHGELVEQEHELVLQRLTDRLARARRQRPQLALVEPERLLAR